MEVGGREGVGYQKATSSPASVAGMRVALALVVGSGRVPPSHQPPPLASTQGSHTLSPVLSPCPTDSFLHTHLVFPLHRSHACPVLAVVVLEVHIETRCKSEYLKPRMTCREVSSTRTYAGLVEHPRGVHPCHLARWQLGTQTRATSPGAAGASGSAEAVGRRGHFLEPALGAALVLILGHHELRDPPPPGAVYSST